MGPQASLVAGPMVAWTAHLTDLPVGSKRLAWRYASDAC